MILLLLLLLLLPLIQIILILMIIITIIIMMINTIIITVIVMNGFDLRREPSQGMSLAQPPGRGDPVYRGSLRGQICQRPDFL